MSEFSDLLKSMKHALIALGVFSLSITFLMLVPSVYMLQVYERVLSSRNEITLLMLTIIMLGLYGMLGAIDFVRQSILARLGAKFEVALSQRVFDATYQHSLKSSMGGNPSQALHDLSALRQFIAGPALIVFFDILSMPVFILASFVLNINFGIFLILGACLLLLLAYLTERTTQQALQEANTLAIKAAHYTNNTLRNAEVIESMGLLATMRQRWQKIQLQIIQKQGVASDRANLIGAGTKFSRMTLQSLALGLGALLALKGAISPGMMIAATILIGRALSPIEQVIGTWKQFIATRGAYSRLIELLERYPKPAATMRLPTPVGYVSVENISANAPLSNIPVISNVSFALEPGNVLGIIGPSGSGKSSLARLLVGVWPSSNGHVRLDGADISQWSKQDLGPFIGYVPQDIELFEGTIAENISRFGLADAEKIVNAAKLAGVHELILQLPQGYDSPVGDSGALLSGGQRQRIALARAVYGEPCFIILDEPNSNLDELGEIALARTIKQLSADKKTVVVVSHRRELLDQTTHLIVIKNGVRQIFGTRSQVVTALNQARQQQLKNETSTERES
jgi:ATP-binding cassette, subfamily C, bacterial exporter for protease/lipase